MSDTLYLQLDQNIQITIHTFIFRTLQNFPAATVKILNRLRVMPVINLDPNKPGRYVMSVMDLISEIKKNEPDLEINNIGEADFIITFKNQTRFRACLAVVQDYFRRSCRLFRCRFLYHDI